MSQIEEKIQKGFNTISNLITSGIEDQKLEKLRFVLQSYSKLLQINRLKVSVQVRLQRCDYCGKPIKQGKKTISLKCKHKICSKNCFKSYISFFTDGYFTDINAVICPRPGCKYIISQDFIKNMHGGEEVFKKFKQDLLNKSRRFFTCEMCDKEEDISNSVSLTCDHQFCKGCIHDHIAEMLAGNDFNFTCSACQEEIPPYLIDSILTREEIDLLNKKVIENMI